MTIMKSVITILLIIVCTALSTNIFSQQKPALHFPKVTYGEVTERFTTKEKVLSNPKLICKEPNCEVTCFSFMILPRERNIIGPYHIVGDQLTPKLISTVKDLPNLRTSIFIDSIEVLYQGKKMQVPGISFQYGN